MAELARRGYDSGYASLLEVLDAQRNYRDVLLDFLSAEAATALARLDLEWASGGPPVPNEDGPKQVQQQSEAASSPGRPALSPDNRALPPQKVEGLK